MTQLKVCGLTQLSDLELIAGHDATYAGIIRVPNTPRYVNDIAFCELVGRADSLGLKSVAVYSDDTVEHIISDVSTSPLTVVQLHGQENAGYCKQLKQRLPEHVELWKVFSILEPLRCETLSSYQPFIDKVLLDLPKGCNVPFKWQDNSILEANLTTLKAKRLPFILAGKLRPETVASVIKRYAPYAIDIASGVEKEPGIKSEKLIKSLVCAFENLRHGEI